MEAKEESLNLDYYAGLVFKHRWLVIIPFCLSMVVGIILSVVLPKTYEASAYIIERPQSVPKHYVSDIVTGGLDDRIDTMSKQILSWKNLEKIINQLNLFMGPNHEDMNIEDKIAELRSGLDIEIMKRDPKEGGPNMFSVSYEGSEQELVAQVVNSLAALFIDENLREREAQANETRLFLEDELQEVRKQLEIVENKLKEYRKIHMGELPEQLETNLRMIDGLRRQLDQRYDSLRSTKDRLMILENQFEADLNMMMAGGESGESLSLPQLQQKLAMLELSYTERHPDVIRLKTRIAEMEAKIESGEYDQTPTPMPLGSIYADSRQVRLHNNQMQQKAALELEIKNLELNIQKINGEIAEYELRVENTPRLEQEVMTLQRDYSNIQKSYMVLLDRKLQADVSVNMERKQKGDQFQIVGRAYVPDKPSSPNLLLIFLAINFVSLNLGGGLIFLIDYFDTSLKSSKDFDQELGISLLATIPKIYHAKDRRMRKLRKVMTVFSLLVSFLLFAGFAVLTFIGPDTILELIRNILYSQTA